MNKQNALDHISREVAACSICKIGKSGKAVPGEGNPDADVVFVGEAPGKKEAQTGRPFIGRSGKLLRGLMQEIGLQEDQVFITSVVKYLPDCGTPSASDIAHAREHTLQQLEIIHPHIIVLLGSVAALGILGEKIPISQKHGEVISKNGRQYVIMYHPSAALRFPAVREAFRKDFLTLKKLLRTHSLLT